jgi:hypothetical protein
VTKASFSDIDKMIHLIIFKMNMVLNIDNQYVMFKKIIRDLGIEY